MRAKPVPLIDVLLLSDRADGPSGETREGKHCEHW